MRKTILALAFVLGAMGTVSVFAADDNNNLQTDKKECVKNRNCERGGRRCFKPFEGITLTQEQQTKLDALKAEKCPRVSDCKKDDCKKECKADKQNCQANDRNCKGGKCDFKNGKRDYLNKVKGVLTPEQYVIFLENIVVNQPDMKGRPRPHHKMDKAACNRPDGQGKRQCR